MKKVVAIGGVPGTGKTTLITKFLESNLPELKQLRKLITGHEYDNCIVLGDYSRKGVFKGTDTFSMACQPEAEQFFVENSKNVVYEGDRIFNKKMLEFVQNQGYNLLVIILEADDKLLQERYDQRGSEQSDKFINGRKTKYQNIKDDANFNVYTVDHMNSDDTEKIVDAIHEFLNDGNINKILQKVEHNSLDDFFS